MERLKKIFKILMRKRMIDKSPDIHYIERIGNMIKRPAVLLFVLIYLITCIPSPQNLTFAQDNDTVQESEVTADSAADDEKDEDAASDDSSQGEEAKSKDESDSADADTPDSDQKEQKSEEAKSGDNAEANTSGKDDSQKKDSAESKTEKKESDGKNSEDKKDSSKKGQPSASTEPTAGEKGELLFKKSTKEDSYTIRVTGDKGSGIEKVATMNVVEINEKDSIYTDSVKKLNKSLEKKKEGEIKDIRLYQILFKDKDGKQVALNDKVKVNIVYKDKSAMKVDPKDEATMVRAFTVNTSSDKDGDVVLKHIEDVNKEEEEKAKAKAKAGVNAAQDTTAEAGDDSNNVKKSSSKDSKEELPFFVTKTNWVDDKDVSSRIVKRIVREVNYSLNKNGVTGVAVIGTPDPEETTQADRKTGNESNTTADTNNNDDDKTDAADGGSDSGVDQNQEDDDAISPNNNQTTQEDQTNPTANTDEDVAQDPDKTESNDSETNNGVVEPEGNDNDKEPEAELVGGKKNSLTASDGDCKVVLGYDDDAGIPDGATLSIRAIEEGSDEYDAYLKQAATSYMEEENADVKKAKFYDIKILDEDGEEVEPSGPVTVKMTFDSMYVKDNGNLDIVHFDESGIDGQDENKDKKPETIEDVTLFDGDRKQTVNGVEFETGGFSVYGILYTVDFHWGDHTWKIVGADSILLSDLFDKLHITEIDFDDVESVSFSNQDLVAVEEKDGDWLLTSLKPFDSEETLSLTLKNGAVVTIMVTDQAVTITADSAAKAFDNTPLTKDTYTVTGELDEGDSIQSVTVTGSQTEIGSSDNVPSDAVIINAEGEDVTANYTINYVNGTLTVTEGEPITITANSSEKIYDGEPLSVTGYTITSGELKEGHTLDSVVVTGSQTDAGVGESVPSDAVILDDNKENVTDQYTIFYNSGTLNVKPASVTLTANCGTRKKAENGDPINLGYTCSVEGLTFDDSVSVTSETAEGMYDVTFTGVTLGETTDTTGNYVVTKTVNGLMIIEGEHPILEKTPEGFEGNRAHYKIVINPDSIVLNDGHPYTMKDTFGTDDSHPQSINYGSIQVTCDPVVGDVATWDYSGYTGTFSIPDGTCVTIEYYTRVGGNAGEDVDVTNTAELGKMVDKSFISAASDTVAQTLNIEPDIYGTGGVYTIGLYVYADGHMETGLGGATFRLLDMNKQPMKYTAGDKAGQEITFTTGDGSDSEHRAGYVTIGLNEEDDGLSIHKNTVYYLEMVTAPYTVDGSQYTYYQRDNTYYSFLITDEANYTYGGIYSYYNGDVMKVRCYPESGGVNVMKRFSGNFELTDEQKNNITFTLEKEVVGDQDEWVPIESHTYEEFKYGTLNFDIKADDLEDGATYRMIETNALPEELEETVDLNAAVSVTYQIKGEPVEDDTGEFTVDPDDKTRVSNNFVFTNEYVDHKLMIVKLDEMTGQMLSGAEFTVYRYTGETLSPILANVYTTDNSGMITIRRNDEGANYYPDQLYYVTETNPPGGHILPDNPEKFWFYFSENGSKVPEGLPEGETATDLTTSYTTVGVGNASTKANIPVSVSWGHEEETGSDAWPDTLGEDGYIVIGLYQSVGDGDPEPVLDGDNNPRTLTLTKTDYFDTDSFTNLPAKTTSGDMIKYSVKEEGIYDSNNINVMDSYEQSSSISGTGWYIVNNRDAVSVTINKKWYENDGVTPVTDTSGKTDVTFDIYRSSVEKTGTISHDELVELIGSSEPVRTDLTLSNSNNWSLTVPSLEKDDGKDHPWYYYALEDIPDNQIDTYEVAAATDSTLRTITIKNRQTPSTVTITANDLEKFHGQTDPDFDLSATVTEIDGSDSEIVINAVLDGDGKPTGNYTATVTRADQSTVTISFTVSRAEGEDVGTYAITPSSQSGDELQHGYRVLYVPGTLTIKQLQVTVTAGATKTYGDTTDPSLATITITTEGVDPSDVSFNPSDITYTATREIGEDVGTYPITLTGERNQGNYYVTYVQGNFVITPAPVTVKADDCSKAFGEEDPEFTATVTGLKYDDSASVIEYDLTRAEGEDVGEYTITPSGEEEQGNYTVTYETGTLTITRAAITIGVDDAEKIYGEGDPEWSVQIDGLQDEDEGGTFDVSEEGRVRTYTYKKKGSEDALLTFIVTRDEGEDIGDYHIRPDGDANQGNYTVSYKNSDTNSGKLSISRAELLVTANNMVKPKLNPPADDPLLTATITGWANGDGYETDDEADPKYQDRTIATSSVSEDGVVTWTYTRNNKTLLTFTLKRDSGEAEGEYTITTEGVGEHPNQQSNYFVSYEGGIFSILSMFNVEVSQDVDDPVGANEDPTYHYKAEVDLSGSGLPGKYNDNNFTDGVLVFTLPDDDAANLKTLRVPAGAKLTVTRNSDNSNYTTALSVDGTPLADNHTCVINSMDDFYGINYRHTRICLPVQAMADPDETGVEPEAVSGSNGYVGIPEDEYTINEAFAREYQSRIKYTLPTDKYYVYDNAALYHYDSEGNVTNIVTNITKIKYDGSHSVWQYKAGDAEYADIPDGAQLSLIYKPKFICKVDTEKFYTINEAVNHIGKRENKTGIIDMMLVDYSMPETDAVTIPEGYDITIRTATSEYEGTDNDDPDDSIATISRTSLFTDGYLFENKGKLTLDRIILDGHSIESPNALVANTSSTAELDVNSYATIQNAKGTDGGAIYVSGGTATVSGNIINNTATNGGAVYVSEGTVTIKTFNGTTFSGNSATYGGGVYMAGGTVNIGNEENTSSTVGNADSPNTATNGGAVYMTDGTLNIIGTVSYNTATSGGAVFMTGGTVNMNNADSKVISNNAEQGGAFYIEGGTINMTAGEASGNTATSGGGFIYGTNGDITISGGTINGNTATNGNGGAISYIGGGAITFSGGTFTGNSADAGYGGAIYQSSGTVTLSGGTIGGSESGKNTAKNGSAIYVADGAATFSGVNINNNTASNGGAVGVGSITARLHFSGDTKIQNNYKGSGTSTKSNVYLDQDSDLIINSSGLGDNAAIGVYIADSIISTRGDACSQFGTYSKSDKLDSLKKFANDRSEVLEAHYHNYKLIWTRFIQLNVRYVSSMNDIFSNNFKPKSDNGTGTQLYPNKANSTVKFYPTSRENSIYELVTQLCNDYYKSKVSNYIYAYTYVYNANIENFNHFLTDINWDSRNQKWLYVQHGGNIYGGNNPRTIIVYYSDAAYISLTNNSGHDLTINPMTVLGKNVVTTNYGYPTVIDYLTQDTLVPIADSKDNPATPVVEPHVVDENKNIVIPSGGYAKLLFPGACTSQWSITGEFANVVAGDKIHYTLDSLNTPATSDSYKLDLEDLETTQRTGDKLTFSLSGQTLSPGQTYDILFGDPTPICKIEDDIAAGGDLNTEGKYEHPFTTLNGAWTYITTNHSSDKTATIEMLMDYQQPGDDVLNISAGYNITITTAVPKLTSEGDPNPDARGTRYTYFGSDPERATISRDNTNDHSAIIAEAHTGDPDNDVLTKDECNSSLTIKNVIFDGKALAKDGNGGAVNTHNFIVKIEDCIFKGYQAVRGGAVFVNWGDLVVKHTRFSNCQTENTADKTGGGAIWTTAKELEVEDCYFELCRCLKGNAQGGAVFHNIRSGGKTIYDETGAQTFPDGFSEGTKTTIKDAKFYDCYSNTGSGGTVESDAWIVELTGTEFHGSFSGKSGGNGGALNCYTNDNVDYTKIDSYLTISDCVFDDCSARQGTTRGGAIRTRTRTTLIEDTTFKDTYANKGGAIYNDSGAEKKLTISGCTFENCVATGDEGAFYTNAPELIIGDSSFKDCTAPTYGCVCQNKDSSGSSAIVTNTSFENCISTNSRAGALYTIAKTLSVTGLEDTTTFKNCSATGDGGAIYHKGSTETFDNCSFEGCVSGTNGGGAYLVDAALTMNNTKFTNCSAENDGGGLYLTTGTTSLNSCEFSGNSVAASASRGGALYINKSTVTLNNLKIQDSDKGSNTAAYGGGIYQNEGTLYINGGTIENCKASISGGALYSRKACYLGDFSNSSILNISDCYAVTSGGGVYHASDLYPRNVNISSCYSKQGGGVYSAAKLDISTAGMVFSISDCHAKDVTLNKNNVPNVADQFKSDNLGGGIYKGASNDWNIKSSAVAITGCSAYDGGGIYYGTGGTLSLTNCNFSGNHAENNGGCIYQNAGTINYSGGTIAGNTATEKGGGFYKAGGSFTMSGGTIGGSNDNKNTASHGAGIFVADGQTMTMSGGSITYNNASTAGGGIAVGGSSSVLNFQGNAVVQNNTMGSGEEQVDCNVYLDQDSNAIIRTTSTSLGANAYIGVYCSDDQDPSHGFSGMPFGTYNKTDNLNKFFNDRRPYLFGVRGSKENQIVWCTFVCKITDGEGNLLYKDGKGTPALYNKLESHSNTDTSTAFGTLFSTNNPALYKKEGGTYASYTGDYQIQMLVQEYEVTEYSSIKAGRTITLTTAAAPPAEPDPNDFYYTGDQKHPYATIKRGGTFKQESMITSRGIFTLTNIILDGGAVFDSEGNNTTDVYATESGSFITIKVDGNNPSVTTIGANATLQNAYNKNHGGAVFLHTKNAVLNLDGGTITNCHVADYKNGGAVYFNTSNKDDTTNLTFNFKSGTISNCSAYKGGAIYLENKSNQVLNMSGGTITGCNATNAGGAIAENGNNTTFSSSNARLYFSGHVTITDNTCNNSVAPGQKCNVQLDYDSNVIINAKDLENGAEIGVYVSGNTGNKVFDNHGEEGDPFGTWTGDFTVNDRPYCFVNDRNDLLRGTQGKTDGDKKIYWARNFLLTLDTEVVSDLAADHNEDVFTYTIQVFSENVKSRSFSGVAFNGEGKATVRMKDVDAPITIHFPDSVIDTSSGFPEYSVQVNYTKEQSEDYSPKIRQNEGTVNAKVIEGTVAEGTLGENLEISPPSGRSTVTYVHTRFTGSLTISKTVSSEDDQDKETKFPFNISLDDTGISKTYTAKDAEGNPIEEGITFDSGESTFTLKDSESITIEGLPTDLIYTIAEDLSSNPEAGHIRTKTNKDGKGEISGRSMTGTLGDVYTMDGDQKVYASTIEFTNNYMEIVCKILNRSRALLYYEESDGGRVPAIYDNLADAFAKVNQGGLMTYSGGTVSGLLRIEMIVPEYTMTDPAELGVGKTVILSTALTTDTDTYPYTGEVGGTSIVTRGEFTNSMITNHGTLTLDKITLDGGSGASEPLSADSNGGIIQVDGVKLTVNEDATLQNSATTENGGAIWLDQGADLTMNGIIKDCQAASGGGIFANTGFKAIYVDGTITGCEATSRDDTKAQNGGGICALTGSSIAILSNAKLLGNKAESGNGGAICSDANVTLRGTVGGLGTIVGSEKSEANIARYGGGLYMGSDTTFTMYSTASIVGNTGVDGGGMYTVGTARISGGSVSGNEATGNGGGVYAGETASVLISGSSTVLNDNEAAYCGGAIYDCGTVSMSGGAMSGNQATGDPAIGIEGKGGAVYVVDGHTFTMSGGTISNNKSSEGAISTGEHSVLNFSSNAIVKDNTDLEDTTIIKNVYLGYPNTDIIKTTGLGSRASIGVYVADGVDYAILYEHGIADRNFGTYTGSTPGSARLEKFHNDRDIELDGIAGDQQPSRTDYFVMWPGKNLYIQVKQYDIQYDVDGNPLTDGEGNYIPIDEENLASIKGAGFTLTNIKTSEEVWSGLSSSKSGSEGLVTIPWSKIENIGSNTAIFARNSYYILNQTTTSTQCVVPAGSWLVHIGEGNKVYLTTIESGQTVSYDNENNTVTITPEEPTETKENRTFDMKKALDDNEASDGEKGVLGDTFIILNDRQPDITFDANGGTLYNASKAEAVEERTDVVVFGNETHVDYTIKERNPVWNTIFLNWNTERDGSGTTYEKGDVYKFYRHSDFDDLTLYAQWVPIVCKITDRDGNLLYVNGEAAIYGKLETAFNDYMNKNFKYANGKNANARFVKMLVDSYDLSEPLKLEKKKVAYLTTATDDADNEDGYPFYSSEGKTVCTINRGFDEDSSMITINNFHLALQNITLDGGSEEGKTVSVNGGLVNVQGSEAYPLHVLSGATLCNSTTIGVGPCIYINEGSKMNISGSPIFSNNTVVMDGYDEKTNGGDSYTDSKVHQDIFIAGYENNTVQSLVVTGDLSGTSGSIWVWADETPHYEEDKQFATYTTTNPPSGLNVFRNAQDDITTSGQARSVFLCGIVKDEDVSDKNKYISWGTEGIDIIFDKVDSNGEPLTGARFTLFKTFDYDTEEKKISLSDITNYTGESASEKTDKIEKGQVVLKSVPNGTYYMQEAYKDPDDDTKLISGIPDGYTGDDTYILLIGGLARSASKLGTGILENINEAAVKAQLDPDNDGDNDYDYAFFWIDPSTGLAAASTSNPEAPDIANFGIMNENADGHKVIIRKVSDTYTSLEGARFRIFRENMSEITADQPTYVAGESIPEGKEVGDKKGYYESTASGVYFIGDLPDGKYYLWEIKAPNDTNYSDNAGKVFVLTVNNNGVSQKELGKVSGTLIKNGSNAKTFESLDELKNWMKTHKSE